MRRAMWLVWWTVASLSAIGWMTSLVSPAVAERNAAEIELGQKVYLKYCGACHGTDARGRTSLSELFRMPPPDLRRLAARREGWFPEALVRELIDGRFPIHGERKMPIWGRRLSEEQILAITKYLHGIQDPF